MEIFHDIVFVECEKCGNRIEFKSKIGNYAQQEYGVNHVPVVTAHDLNGNTEKCSFCNKIVTITIPIVDHHYLAMDVDYSE